MSANQHIAISSAKLYLVGIGLSIFCMAVITAVALWGNHSQAQLVEKLYRHPFTVSSHVLEAQTHLESMHRYMREVTLASNESVLNDAAAKVGLHERAVLHHLETAKSEFLGNKEEFQSLIDSVTIWRDLWSKVIQLTREGKHTEAVTLARSEGEQYDLLLTNQMEDLVSFARLKAVEFLNQSRNQTSRYQTLQATILVIVLVTVIVALTFMYKLIHGSETNLKESEYRYRSIYQNVPLSIWDEDYSTVFAKLQQLREHGITDLRAYFEDYPEVPLQLANKVVVNKVNETSLSTFAANTQEELISSIAKTFGEGALEVFVDSMLAIWNGKSLFISKANFVALDGRKIKGQISISLPKTLQESYFVPVVIEDVTKVDAYENELKHLAQFDPLTQLPNRVLFADRLRQAIAMVNRSGSPLALAYIDLDGFKAVNDTYGHNVGDILLLSVANRMKATLREVDAVARLGGDEFVAIINDIKSKDSLDIMLSRLLHEIANPFEIGGVSISISVSIGVTMYRQNEQTDCDQLERQADQAMYEAKLAGRNTFRFFDPKHDNIISRKFKLISEVEIGLQSNQFALFFQPKLHLKTGTIVGAEALIRWYHPTDGLLSPAYFIPQIENDSISIKLGEWVIEAALQKLEQWYTEGVKIPISVNIGALQLQDKNFVTRLSEIIEKHPNIPPELLELEILEAKSIANFEQTADTVKQGLALGITFSLDDFGSGYSSLVYLKKLPVTTLKIDQEFIRSVLSSNDDEMVLKGVLGLAKNFQKGTLAEGVETPEHVELLLKLGCEYGQGYAISKPLESKAFMEWVANWQASPSWYLDQSQKHVG